MICNVRGTTVGSTRSSKFARRRVCHIELYLRSILWRVITSSPDSLGLEENTGERYDKDLSTSQINGQNGVHCFHVRPTLHACRVVYKLI